jgi:hypothetical protein
VSALYFSTPMSDSEVAELEVDCVCGIVHVCACVLVLFLLHLADSWTH